MKKTFLAKVESLKNHTKVYNCKRG